MKKRFTEEQIIGFLREADAGFPLSKVVDEIERFPSWHIDAVLHTDVGTSGRGSPLHSLILAAHATRNHRS